MSKLLFIFCCLTALVSPQSNPTWLADPRLYSGEYKAVQMTSVNPSTFSVPVAPINGSFTTTPRIIISLIGYEQTPPCAGCQIGYKISVITVTATTISSQCTVYGSSMTYLRYFFLAIKSTAWSQFHVEYQSLQFPASHNLMDTASASRSATQVMSNVAGEDYSTTINSNKIVMLIYLVGFKTDIGTTGIFMKLDVQTIDGTTHLVSFQTSGNAKVSEITYYRMSYDETALVAPGNRVIENWDLSGVDSIQTTYTAWGTMTDPNTQLKYRNYLMGFKDVVINNAITTSQNVDFMLEFRIYGRMIYESLISLDGATYNTAIPSFTYLNGRTFHNRMPVCSVSPDLLYVRSTQKCMSACPVRTYLQTAYSPNFCETCHATCLTCSGSTSTTCSTCDLANDFRVIDSGTNECLCTTGYYENPSPFLCSPCIISGCSACIYSATNSREECTVCDIPCLTCLASSYCLSCDTSIRELVQNSGAGTSTCQCLNLGISNPDGTCSTPSSASCGDGITGSGEECDDGNTVSSDGCSSTCTVETDHTCEQATFNNGTSLCYYSRAVQMLITSVLKVLTANQVSISLDVNAPNCNAANLERYFETLSALELSDSRRLLQLKHPNTSEEEAQAEQKEEDDESIESIEEEQENRGEIMQRAGLVNLVSSATIRISRTTFTSTGNGVGVASLLLDYSQTISTLNNKRFNFISSASVGSDSQRYFFATPISTVLLEDPYNNVPLVYYQDAVYSSISSISTLYLVLIILALLFFFVLIAFRRSVIAVEMLLVVQFAYFCILGQQSVEIGMSAFGYYGRFSIGLNFNLMTEQSSLLDCSGMGEIYQTCNTINNLNVFVYIGTLALFIAMGIQTFKNQKQKSLDEVSNYYTQSSYRSNISQFMNPEPKIPKDDAMKAMARTIAGVYDLPSRIQLLSQICLEITFGVYFLTAIEYLITAVNQGSTGRIESIVFLVFLGVLFVMMWFGWFKFYPIKGLSYLSIAPHTLMKISFFKFHYLGLFMFLLLWGLILALAPGVVSYILLMVWSGLWIAASVKKGIYKHKFNKVRSIINQIITLMIACFYIVMEYGDVGNGIGFSISIAVLLFLCLMANIGLAVYIGWLQKKNGELMSENNEQLKKYASNYSQNAEGDNKTQLKPVQVHEMAGYFNQKATPKKSQFMESQMRSVVKQKITELKNMKKQLKITSPNENLSAEGERVMVNKLQQLHEEHTLGVNITDPDQYQI